MEFSHRMEVVRPNGRTQFVCELCCELEGFRIEGICAVGECEHLKVWFQNAQVVGAVSKGVRH